jgi:hypothetical protein
MIRRHIHNDSNVVQCIAFFHFLFNTMQYKGVDIMSISIRTNDEELGLIKKYVELDSATVSEVMRKAILEKIEEEYDISFKRVHLKSAYRIL